MGRRADRAVGDVWVWMMSRDCRSQGSNSRSRSWPRMLEYSKGAKKTAKGSAQRATGRTGRTTRTTREREKSVEEKEGLLSKLK
jgi:hypothetical protein